MRGFTLFGILLVHAFNDFYAIREAFSSNPIWSFQDNLLRGAITYSSS
ncbi:hypothetical protein ADIS_1432 [Lunatimonas lonarensis]|uniref:Uncharacterized protein n=1 Tax=Lunatimonas lonarensis TaxID=1232681 RepID=R7ZVR1_9BACT|nr:hypothetical protein ADIS_1432 [Lunatimonas lonarensis]